MRSFGDFRTATVRYWGAGLTEGWTYREVNGSNLALARAYLREAQLLILDEPTASLDARSEREVFERFADLTQGRLALLISHRFSTVRMADRVLVLEGGQITEQGSHHQLLVQGGRYSELFGLQAANYR